MNVPVTPTPGTDASAEVAIATLEARFMAGPLATIDEDALQRWQPKPMGWFLRLQQLLAQRAPRGFSPYVIVPLSGGATRTQSSRPKPASLRSADQRQAKTYYAQPV